MEPTGQYLSDINFSTGLFDNLSVQAKVDFGGTLAFNFLGAMPVEGIYTFLHYENFHGLFQSIFLPERVGYQFDVVFEKTSASLFVTAVPIPTAWLLFGSAMGLAGLISRRRDGGVHVEP